MTCIERAFGMPDSAKELGTKELQADTDDQCRMSRYVIKTSNPEYYRAFAAVINDPVSGQYSWTPEERDAYRRVKELERGMVLGTGSAGGAVAIGDLSVAAGVSRTRLAPTGASRNTRGWLWR